MWKTALVSGAIMLSAGIGAAQDALTVGRPLGHDIAEGETYAYSIQLNAGDYVGGTVDQRGIVVTAVVFSPDGSRLRGFPGPPTGRRPVAFIAEAAGSYRIELQSPMAEKALATGMPYAKRGTFVLELTQKLSFEERLQRRPQHQDKYTSPRIEALRAALSSGNAETAAFWRSVEATGAPLVDLRSSAANAVGGVLAAIQRLVF